MTTSETDQLPTSGAPSAVGATKALTVRGASVLGIGSMIGAGIFARLGEAGAVAGPACGLVPDLLAIVLDALVRLRQRSAHPPEGRPLPSPAA